MKNSSGMGVSPMFAVPREFLARMLNIPMIEIAKYRDHRRDADATF